MIDGATFRRQLSLLQLAAMEYKVKGVEERAERSESESIGMGAYWCVKIQAPPASGATDPSTEPPCSGYSVQVAVWTT